MLYETLSQPAIFFTLVISGFLTGFIFDFLNLLKKHIKIQFFNNFLLFFCVFLAIFIFFIINLKTNYGQFRLYTIFCFCLSFAIQRFIFSNIFAKNLDVCYNKPDKRKDDEDKIIQRKIRKRVKN